MTTQSFFFVGNKQGIHQIKADYFSYLMRLIIFSFIRGFIMKTMEEI